MNIQRAKEISGSGKSYQVTFNGKPIYIQHVDEGKATARIFFDGNPEDEHEVSVTELKEE
ncbi:H-type small acid-soluble spore protein [Metabacillus arenae]|uniref:Small, acid-soluble spore protein H n=1 Tax=Metabacillus arenae TaxID=2771434 RepID=A0A926NHS6_9BACI|nr:H-type small acid-soluble spore protein [Metabacillus arenae]MBD1381295.1 H-type small acid-soluble spore protein [Metabacillus arenae]